MHILKECHHCEWFSFIQYSNHSRALFDWKCGWAKWKSFGTLQRKAPCGGKCMKLSPCIFIGGDWVSFLLRDQSLWKGPKPYKCNIQNAMFSYYNSNENSIARPFWLAGTKLQTEGQIQTDRDREGASRQQKHKMALNGLWIISSTRDNFHPCVFVSIHLYKDIRSPTKRNNIAQTLHTNGRNGAPT